MVIEKRNKKDCILRATVWNAKSLLNAVRRENFKREMVSLSLDVVGLSEVRWPLANDLVTGKYWLISSEANQGKREWNHYEKGNEGYRLSAV